jgi:signal transduction histidine kinase
VAEVMVDRRGMAGDDGERSDGAFNRQRQLISDAAHEFLTPIAGMRAELEVARLHLGHTDLPEMLDRMLRNVDRLQELTADMLFLARLRADLPAERERVDLAELVQTEIRHQTGLPLEVRLCLDSGVVVDACHAHIGQVLRNLIENAGRHARRIVHIQVRRDGHTAELAVADDGEGIAEADRERIFDCFTRLDTARSRKCGGSGLGMTIARDIAHAYDGTLHVEDSPLGGAHFTLRLPLTTTPTTPDMRSAVLSED